MVALRDDKMDVSRGRVIAANFKVLNGNIQVEINAAKMALATGEGSQLWPDGRHGATLHGQCARATVQADCQPHW